MPGGIDRNVREARENFEFFVKNHEKGSLVKKNICVPLQIIIEIHVPCHYRFFCVLPPQIPRRK